MKQLLLTSETIFAHEFRLQHTWLWFFALSLNPTLSKPSSSFPLWLCLPQLQVSQCSNLARSTAMCPVAWPAVASTAVTPRGMTLPRHTRWVRVHQPPSTSPAGLISHLTLIPETHFFLATVNRWVLERWDWESMFYLCVGYQLKGERTGTWKLCFTRIVV